jgi:uncharacterized protein (TIGR02217 family)
MPNDVGIVSAAGGVLTVGGVVIAGLTWPMTKQPFAQTRIQRAVSGRELRAMDYPYPLYQYQLVFNFLRQGGGFNEANTLLGLIEACVGAWGTFLFDDPSDDTASGQFIGTGDGSTTQFQLQYAKGGSIAFTRPVDAVNALTAVYFNGVVQSSGGYSIATGVNSTGLLTFGAPPGSGVSITADFTYYFRCRFTDDSYSFDNFMYRLWELKKLTFLSVFP